MNFMRSGLPLILIASLAVACSPKSEPAVAEAEPEPTKEVSHPWDWVPLHQAGLIRNVTHTGSGKLTTALLQVEPGVHRARPRWKLLAKLDPFNDNDARWITASGDTTSFSCEVVSEAQLEIDESLFEVKNVREVEFMPANSLARQLGWG